MTVLPMKPRIEQQPPVPPPPPPPPDKPARNPLWFRLAWIAFSLCCVQIIVARPLAKRLDGVEQQVQAVDSTVDASLKGFRGLNGDVESVTQILMDLRLQREQIEEAQDAVIQLRTLRQAIEVEALRVPEAEAALRRFADLSEQVQELEEEQQLQSIFRRPPVADMSALPSQPELLSPSVPAVPLEPPPAPVQAQAIPVPPPVEINSKHLPEVVRLADRWHMVIRPARPVVEASPGRLPVGTESVVLDKSSGSQMQPSEITSAVDVENRALR
ncbi:hypothetical protein [Planctomicrobium sp. SH664]|uniref:hypothetical protein n=1 Tax=Planctomicrobium sp. SH664 TaxID=3448125 RepID=UPI003F5B5489